MKPFVFLLLGGSAAYLASRKAYAKPSSPVAPPTVPPPGPPPFFPPVAPPPGPQPPVAPPPGPQPPVAPPLGPQPPPKTRTPEEQELVDGIKALVKNKFGGDYGAAFDAYAGPDGKIDSDELSTVLEQAGIGNGLTRGFWVSGVLDKVDQDGDRKISWPEFQAVIE
jgi:hypothetical protein